MSQGTRIDFEGLAASLLAQARALLPAWFPEGKLRGHEFLIGSLQGEAGTSLSINVETGQWCDFAAGEKGADLINLYAEAKGLKQGQAARELLGSADLATVKQGRTSGASGGRKPEPRIGPPPDGSPMPSCHHFKHGTPSRIWTYRGRQGEVLNHVARYDLGPGDKELWPWSWDLDAGKWRMKSAPKPRPLYNLDQLAAHPERPALVVEGEKAADAAAELAGALYVATTWAGGGESARFADWSPLYGREVTIWPDADEAGRKAAMQLAELLAPHCPRVKVIDASDRPEGWDAADAAEEGWRWPDVVAWASPRASVYQPPEPEEEPTEEPESPDEMERDDKGAWVNSWLSLGLDLNSNGGALNNLNNAAKVLEQHQALAGHVWFDEFHGKIFTDWMGPRREWSDADDVRFCVFLQRVLGLSRMGVSTAHDAVLYVAKANPRDEVREWLESLAWDGTERLSYLMLEGFGADLTPYTARVGQCWLTSMAARVYAPGAKVDTLPVFEGAQGVGKSTAIKILGGPWYVEAHESINSKDFFAVLQGKLIVEISELDAFRRADVERIKGIISTSVDRYRPPYGRNTADHPRRSVFAGSTNVDHWQQDQTGARRFWPIRCGEIDLEWIRACRDQLFAEAVHRYKAGEDWWTVPLREAQQEQEARRAADTWEDAIEDWLVQRLGAEVSLGEVLEHALHIPPGHQERHHQLRAAAALRNLGWESKPLRTDTGRSQRRWVRKDSE